LFWAFADLAWDSNISLSVWVDGLAAIGERLRIV
jgi:hypothetical protein